MRLSWLAKRARQLSDTTQIQVVLNELVEEVALTTAELRELAQGLHPQLFAERGLAVAVEEYTIGARSGPTWTCPGSGSRS